MLTIKFGERDALYELVHREVFNSISHEAGLTAESTGKEGFSTARFTINEYVLRSSYKAAVHELHKSILCEITLIGAVYIFKHRVIPKLACLQIHLRFLGASVLPFCFSHASCKEIDGWPFIHR